MIGPPEILFLLVLLLFVAGPAVAGVLIWKFVIKSKPDASSSSERLSTQL